MIARFPADLLHALSGSWESAKGALRDGLDAMGASIQANHHTFDETITLPSGVKIRVGAGSPEGLYGDPKGSVFHRTDLSSTTSLYVKQTAAGILTGWTAK